jgi:hypothetical protein
MFLIDDVKRYVSSSPNSLAVLRKLQDEADRKFEELKNEPDDTEPPIDPSAFERPEGDDRPF